MSGSQNALGPYMPWNWGGPSRTDIPDYSNFAVQPTYGPETPANLAGLGNPAQGAATGLGFNVGTGQLALSGLGTLGNLWTAFQAQSLAKKQFDFTKNVTNTNLANQIKSYNTTLSDRARSRGVTEGQSPDQVSDYITRNQLAR